MPRQSIADTVRAVTEPLVQSKGESAVMLRHNSKCRTRMRQHLPTAATMREVDPMKGTELLVAAMLAMECRH